MPNQTDRPGDGRLALITGASSGIGEALAVRLAAHGWRVVAAARRRAALEALAERASGPGRIIPQVLDVTDADAFAALVTTVEADHGEIDTVILNAGGYEPVRLDELDAAVFERLIRVNYLGTVNGLAACLPAMRRRGRGQVLVMGSLSAYRGLPRAAAYGSTKAAVLSLAESLRPEAERAGIALRVVSPGFVKSRLTERNDFRMPQLMDPADAAAAIHAGIDGNGFEVFFPRRLGWTLKLLRLLPYRLYFALMRRLA
ncbi:putative oxidoreductase [wastewater metagenome]|uniref:Putative oxidoreductase n=2 Tax=unclassified sequences TaxID=12908 RepID=A0A5B8RCW6_9ZZZZ|nr:putative oxidoreductase [uncultured organism]